jgi:hypothetical protein
MNTRKMLAIAGFLTFTFTGAVRAEEEVATGSLTLVTTKMKTTDGWILDYEAYPSPVEAASPTTMSCPATAPSCTLRVDLTLSITPQGEVERDVVEVTIDVDGSTDGVHPVNPSRVIFPAFCPLRTHHVPFVFFKKGLAPGDHTVTVRFRGEAGAAIMGYGTLTLQMFRLNWEFVRR